MKMARLHSLAVALPLCAFIATSGSIAIAAEKATDELVSAGGYTIEKRYLDRDCRQGLGWKGFTIEKFVDCVRVQAALLPPLDRSRRDHFGEIYDPIKYRDCRIKTQRPGDATCDPYRLRRVENPEYWPYPDLPKPKLPEPPNPPVYKRGMSAEEYFQALCKAEAGEFIYKTVESVEGIYQIRPRMEDNDYENEDRYVPEDPFGNKDSWAFFQTMSSGKYKFIETKKSPQRDRFREVTPSPRDVIDQHKGYWRYKRINDKPVHSTVAEAVESVSARYGITWHGISRSHDREMGIAGGELIIIDMRTAEILAIRRGFAKASGKTKGSHSGIWWLTAKTCPEAADGQSSGASFITRVLVPAN